jgi:hypothetical protein
MLSLTASTLMPTEVRSPAVSDQEMLKSQIVERKPLEQGIPPGRLLASPANAGVKGRGVKERIAQGQVAGVYVAADRLMPC